MSKTLTFLIIALFATGIIEICQCGNATFVNWMSNNQYTIQFLPYIAQYNSKKCYNRPGSDPKSCQRYCQTYYDYVPSLPYKNAQNYNPATRQCEPRPYCPNTLGVVYVSATKTCKDKLMNRTVPPQDAPLPVYNGTFPVTIVCQYGSVTTFLGKTDCLCDFGWGSLPVPNFSSKKSVIKCNEPIPLSAYFPNFMKVYYDQTYDNIFPYGGDPDYWVQSLQYYVRQLKYMIQTFFFPYQVQIVVLTIPCEPTIRPQDIIWFTWLMIGLSFLILVSLFEMCVRGVNQNKIKT